MEAKEQNKRFSPNSIGSFGDSPEHPERFADGRTLRAPRLTGASFFLSYPSCISTSATPPSSIISPLWEGGLCTKKVITA